jgi:hypothetical protein
VSLAAMEKRAMRRKSVTQTYELNGKLEAQKERHREDLAERDITIELLTSDLLKK